MVIVVARRMKGYVYAVTVIGPMDEKKASVATFLFCLLSANKCCYPKENSCIP